MSIKPSKNAANAQLAASRGLSFAPSVRLVTLCKEKKAKMKTTLPCPKCSKEFTPTEILEASTLSWPELCWIYFKCPKCGKFTHIQIINGRMSTVNFLGAPGPDWEIISTIEVKHFTIRRDPGFMHAWLDGKHYEFEERK